MSIHLKEWVVENQNKVKLTYEDDTVLYVNKTDFDRAFGCIISADKSDVIRDFALSDM